MVRRGAQQLKKQLKGLSRLQRQVRPDRRAHQPGRAAGVNLEPSGSPDGSLALEIYDYGPEGCERYTVTDVEDLPPLPAEAAVRWINLNNPHEATLKSLGRKYGLHPLALEDALHLPQRIRLDEFEGADFLVMRMLSRIEGRLSIEQISMFIGPDWVITIQEKPGDVWDQVRDRLTRPNTRLRKGGVGTLTHGLIDSIVDHCFPLLEGYNESLEAMEMEALGSASDPEGLTVRLHLQRREEALIRRMMWPLKPVLTQMRSRPWMSEPLEAYLRDVAEHIDQLLEQLELDKETIDALMGLITQKQDERLNEAMKWLAVLSSLFIPSTFIAGVFGMNFKVLPGAEVEWGFWAMLGASAVSMMVMLWVLRRRGWV